MTRVAIFTCKFCGTKYSKVLSRGGPYQPKEPPPASRTLCPDCYGKVMTEIKAWNQTHTGKDLTFLVSALFRKRMAAQSILAVLKTLDETCLACFGGLDGEDEMIQKRQEKCCCEK